MTQHLPHPTVGVIVDVETSGLSYADDVLFEVGMVAIDQNQDVVDTIQVVIASPATRHRAHQLQALADRGDEQAKVVAGMHTENGLFAAIDRGDGVSLSMGMIQLTEWLERLKATGLPMTGSSVGFDRRMLSTHMAPVERLFHYRNIDVSSIKEWVRTYKRDFYDDFIVPRLEELHPRKLHRAVSDCIDTRDELRVYTGVFL